jgi:hypothetical protein
MVKKKKPSKRKYDAALSFAGEDREYVEQVAAHLSNAGIKVFYDKFEEAELWGKDLYRHLSDVYGKKALVTVIFASKHYKKKLWTNRELQSAQARAFESNREYILPALFDKKVTIPGVLKTIGWISLWDRTPEQVADLIIAKLRSFGVEPSARFSYADEARADVDFPRPEGNSFTQIINDMRLRHWPTQAPAVRSALSLDFSTLDKNQIFVLGRNIYQCAEGGEHTAEAVMISLRDKLTKIPSDAAMHLLNGMFFEAYFDHEGNFRGPNLKRRYLRRLFELQKVKKFAPSLAFIRQELQPYKAQLPFLPSSQPENVTFDLVVSKSDPQLVKGFRLRGHSLLVTVNDADDEFLGQLTIAPKKFTLDQLKGRLSEKWSIPLDQIEFSSSNSLDSRKEYRFPEHQVITWPEEGLPE